MTDRSASVRIFADRRDAGRQLAEALRTDLHGEDVLVLALPRGGVPVAYEIASALDAELDVLLVRKLGTPWSPELAAGAIAAGGITVYNRDVLAQLGLDERALAGVREHELAELERRARVYRGDRAPPRTADRVVVLVDDGVATGATMEAAIDAVRRLGPSRVIAAVPTAAEDSAARLERKTDRFYCLATPEPYVAVGAWYRSFEQLADEDVVRLLETARKREGAAPG